MKNIFDEGELIETQVVSKMEITAADGKNYLTNFYSLDAVISVGYRVNSIRATQFRQWATSVPTEPLPPAARKSLSISSLGHKHAGSIRREIYAADPGTDWCNP